MRPQINLTRTRSYKGANWDYLVATVEEKENDETDYMVVKKSKTLEGAARGLREYEDKNPGAVVTILYVGECTDA